MKKKFLSLVLAICLILPYSFLLSACEKITECAYVQFVPTDNEIVKYTADMNEVYTHIYVLPSNYNESQRRDDVYLLKISFKRNLGVDYSIDENPTLCVDIQKWSSMQILIKKDYYYTSSNVPKNVYLNGINITAQAKADVSHAPRITNLPNVYLDGFYRFEDFGLVKGNNTNFINTIEFKA